jgi:hypothetical protein
MQTTCDGVPGFDEVAWDLSNGANGYGSFAALLTGFAISGLVWIGATDRARKSPWSVVLLFASVVPLASAALLYAEVGAEELCGRQVSAIPIPSFLLALGAAGVFTAMFNLLHDDVRSTVYELAAKACLQTVLLLASFSVLTGSISLTANFSPTGEANWKSIVAQSAIIVGVLVERLWRPKWSQALFERMSRPGTENILPLTLLALTVGSYVTYFVIVFDANPQVGYPAELVSWARVSCWCFFLVASRFPTRL